MQGEHYSDLLDYWAFGIWNIVPFLIGLYYACEQSVV